MNKYMTIAIFWSNRNDPIEICAQRVLLTLALLRDYGLNEWFDTDKKGGASSFVQSIKEIVSFLKKEVNTDDEGGVLPELGYTVVFKSQKDFSKSSVLSIYCGAYNSPVPNSVVLELLEKSDSQEISEEHKTVFDNLVRIWDPSSGSISHDLYPEIIYQWEKNSLS
jgi:hypothetical protein